MYYGAMPKHQTGNNVNISININANFAPPIPKEHNNYFGYKNQGYYQADY